MNTKLRFLLPLLFIASCAEPPPPPKEPAGPNPAIEKHAKFEAKMAAARKALGQDDPNKARALAGDARGLADLDDMVAVLAFFGEIDRYLAEAAAEPAREQAAKSDCQGAMETVANAVKETPRREFIKALYQQTEVVLVKCLQREIDQGLSTGNFAAAGASLDLPTAEGALRPEARKALSQRLRDGVVSYVSAQIATDVKEGKYEAAAAKVAEAVSQGVLEAEDEQKTLATIHEAVAPRQIDAIGAAIGSKKKADAPLAELDALAKTLKWTTLPPELAKTRAALATWVECLKLKCAVAKPEAKFSYGKLDVHPGEASSADALVHLPTATKVWIVGRAGKLALVSTEEPPADVAIKPRMMGAAGWVAIDQLKKDDTSDWLPPGDELKDQRVFGPLREGQKKLYQLGFVMSVEGGEAKVKRFLDDQVVSVARSSLRMGKLGKGLKVLTSCPGKTEQSPARVDHEVPAQARSTPLVNVVCLNEDGSDGPAHDEFLGAIAVQPDWLPPPKP
jgi:hypothetical protein